MNQSRNWIPLLDWYQAHSRELPWRETSDPYAIWVSEVMLQQTQVATVIPYYRRWLDRFPTVQRLAEASDQEVLGLWQGLGYYRRCRMLLEGARWVVQNGFPDSREGWLRVPGVGPYTAAAIASIAFGEPAGVVDGNVERVFARLCACRESGAALLKSARIWADRQVDRERPGDWNQALMELGATVCTPKTPKCRECPIEQACIARQTWTVDELPIRSEKTAPVRFARIVWAPCFEGRFGLRQILSGQWSEGMWEFPSTQIGDGGLRSSGEDADLRKTVGPGWLESLGGFSHAITHHRIRIDAWLVRAETASEDLTWFGPAQIEDLPLPSAQRRIFARAMKALGLDA